MSVLGKTMAHFQGSSKKIVLGVAGVVVIAFLALYLFSGLSAMSDVAKDQLASIKSGDMVSAYSMTSKAFQQETTMDTFNAYVNKYPLFKNYQKISFSDRRVENGVGYLRATMEGSDGVRADIEFQLVKADDKWKVQMFRVLTAGVDAGIDKSSATSTASMAQDDSGASIHGVLVSDSADADGYVSDSKAVLSKVAEKIYVTIQIVAPKSSGKVDATLVQPDGTKIGPVLGEISRSGNIMKAFSFARSAPKWPPGEYAIIVNLSSGETKTSSFAVR